jgi:branched-chain amino acid transport system ATP-binding protein
MAEIALKVENLFTAYDRADVLEDLSLEAAEGSITCLLGSNGSGKTTLIRSILGLTRPRAGRIFFQGRDVTALATHRIIRAGLASIPEGRKVFSAMTVAENLRLGAYRESDRNVIQSRLERVYDLFPRLRQRAGQIAGTMSGGEQAMVSIGRGLMGAPKLLILDEPSLGLSPLLVKENFRVIQRLNQEGITIFLVEQNVRQTLAISTYGYVLSKGRVVAQGLAAELSQDREVRQAYFG